MLNFRSISRKIPGLCYNRWITNADVVKGSLLRTKQNERRVRQSVQKQLKKLSKKSMKSIDLTKTGFSIVEMPSEQTLKLMKEDANRGETIEIELEAMQPPGERDIERMHGLNLFDIIIRKNSIKDAYLVVTAAAEPAPQLLSIRLVPQHLSPLDQTVYDGPRPTSIKPEVMEFFLKFLMERGVDENMFKLVAQLSADKYQRDRLNALQETDTFLAPGPSP